MTVYYASAYLLRMMKAQDRLITHLRIRLLKDREEQKTAMKACKARAVSAENRARDLEKQLRKAGLYEGP